MKKILSFTFALLMIGSTSAFGYHYLLEDKDEKITVKTIEGNFIADFTDKRNLVGAVDYVFLGEVISKKGQVDLGLPTTQYEVKVLNEIKGNIQNDEIVLSQYGGYEDEEGKKVLYLFENDPLLESNTKYIFAANKQKDESVLLVPLYGNVKIKDKNQQIALEKEFKDAFNNQKVPEILQRKRNNNETNN
ncbi:Uncharacterised protein [[Flavobacterium] thermophilum]|nr:Uncharacterised protein [[Flavobacterium] thermophilum]